MAISSTSLYPRGIATNGNGIIMVSRRQNESVHIMRGRLYVHAYTNVSPPALGEVRECRCAGVWVSTCSLFALELLPGHRRQKGARSVAEDDRELMVPPNSRALGRASNFNGSGSSTMRYGRSKMHASRSIFNPS